MLSVQGSMASSPYSYNDHGRHSTSQSSLPRDPQVRVSRKRKADVQDNERLSKRLSRLNLAGPNLRKLYATVEDDPGVNQQPEPPYQYFPDGSRSHPTHRIDDSGAMQVDDTKHRVYIYNLDDELSSSESEPEDGRLIFLPDIEKALLANRIPPVVRANPDGQLAGANLDDMQLVLYNVPSSLTVAPEHDSVRKAIIEARARMRDRQRAGGEDAGLGPVPETTPAQVQTGTQQLGAVPEDDDDAMDLS